jgi:hypothetical protein
MASWLAVEEEKKKIMKIAARKSEDTIVGAWDFTGKEGFRYGTLLLELIMKFAMEIGDCGSLLGRFVVVDGGGKLVRGEEVVVDGG